MVAVWRADRGNAMNNPAHKTVPKAMVWYVLLAILAGWFAWPPVQAQESICAQVKIEVRQELALERQGFDAHMRINNGLDTDPLTNVRVDVFFADATGALVLASSDPDDTDASFFVQVSSLEGIDAVDGTGSIAPRSSADIHWLIVPAPGAAGTQAIGKLYYVGATLRYRFLEKEESIEVAPDYIYVKPLPLLALDYFLTRDVYADDAFTGEIEPPEPFTLGLRVKNNGHAVARNVRIESAQPRIIENEQGLLINFQILNGTVDERSGSPSLLLNLGEIGPEQSTVARWELITSLSGQFVEFEAEFSHADELGGALTSIVGTAETHSLVRNVIVDLPGRDAVRDFLAQDGDVLRVYESNGLDTIVEDLSASASLALQHSNGTEAVYDLSTSTAAGFGYVRLTDPFDGTKVVTRVTRSDGKRLPEENAWLSKGRQADTSWAYYVNFFDVGVTGEYEVVFDDAAVPSNREPALQFIADRTVEEGSQLAFIVEASDPDGTVPALAASPLPFGASFIDRNNGQAVFDWTPVEGQAGEYEVTFTASDGSLSVSQLVTFTVEKATNTVPVDDDIAFAKGFNLFAYPMVVSAQHATCFGLLSAIGTEDEIESIARYDSASGLFETCTYQGGIDFPIKAGEAYEVQMLVSKTVRFQGTQACPRVYMSPGMNLLGHPTPPAGYSCFELLRYLGESSAASIEGFNRDNGEFEFCAWSESEGFLIPVGTDFPIGVGKGVLLHSSAATFAPMPGCN